MRKILEAILLVWAVIGLPQVSHAYEPLIVDIPDIYIGDMEDNEGSTVDLNIFRISHAVNLDAYVYGDPNDADFFTTAVRWSFAENPEDKGWLTINGIEGLDLESGEDPARPGAKELTGFPNFSEPFDQEDHYRSWERGRFSSWADFYDLKDSDPITGDPENDPLDTFITIFASNGAQYSSKEVWVRAIDGGWDSPPNFDPPHPPFIYPYLWDAPRSDGFKRHSLPDDSYIDAADGSFYIATHSTLGEKVGISGHHAQSVYGAWYSPAEDLIPYYKNRVYSVKYTIESTAAAGAAPLCRLLSYINRADGSSLVNGGGRLGRGPFQPDADGESYCVYIDSGELEAAGAVNFCSSFELIDFSSEEEGVNYLSKIEICSFDTLDKSSGTPVISYDSQWDFRDWTSMVFGDFISSFGIASCGSDRNGLYIETPLIQDVDARNISYGKWTGGGGDVTYLEDKLYRAVFTLWKHNAAQTLGKIRLVISNDGNNWQTLYTLIPDATDVHLPGSSSREYSVWQESPPFLYTGEEAYKNNMNYIFDLSDGSDSQGGRVYLRKLEIFQYDFP